MGTNTTINNTDNTTNNAINTTNNNNITNNTANASNTNNNYTSSNNTIPIPNASSNSNPNSTALIDNIENYDITSNSILYSDVIAQLNSFFDGNVNVAFGSAIFLSSMKITPKFLTALVLFFDDILYYINHRKFQP